MRSRKLDPRTFTNQVSNRVVFFPFKNYNLDSENGLTVNQHFIPRKFVMNFFCDDAKDSSFYTVDKSFSSPYIRGYIPPKCSGFKKNFAIKNGYEMNFLSQNKLELFFGLHEFQYLPKFRKLTRKIKGNSPYVLIRERVKHLMPSFIFSYLRAGECVVSEDRENNILEMIKYINHPEVLDILAKNILAKHSHMSILVAPDNNFILSDTFFCFMDKEKKKYPMLVRNMDKPILIPVNKGSYILLHNGIGDFDNDYCYLNNNQVKFINEIIYDSAIKTVAAKKQNVLIDAQKKNS